MDIWAARPARNGFFRGRAYGAPMENNQPIVVDADILRTVVASAVSDAFLKVGLDVNDAKETQADLLYLREWRKMMQQARSGTMLAVIKWAMIGLLGLVIVGLSAKFGS